MSDPRIKAAIETALSMVGKKPHDEDLRAYLRGEHLDPRKADWCAAFLNATLRKAGFEPPKSNMATYYLNFGSQINDIRKVRPGDIAVWSYDKKDRIIPPTFGAYGHVGIVERSDSSVTRIVAGGWSGGVAATDFQTMMLGDVSFQRPPPPHSGRIRVMTRMVVK